MNYSSRQQFLNGTDLPDEQAMELVNRFRERVNQAESEHNEFLRIGERMIEHYKNKIWQEEDMAFFEAFDATPIEFSVARPLVNNLISRQRKRRFKHSFVPLDIHSETRIQEQVEMYA